jgi:predicted secreted Zn-dependent protease
VKTILAAVAAFIAMAALAQSPGTSMKIEYYDVRGTNWDELVGEVNAKGPEGWWGHAGTKISYKFRSRGTASGCVIDSATVNADSTVHLPRWANRDEASAALQSQWDDMLRSLERHERGHVQISLDSASELERTLKALPEQATCDALKAIAGQQAERILAEHSHKQDAYDVETDHGRRQ